MVNFTKQLSSIKNYIINLFVNDPDIVAAIDNPDIQDAEDLIYNNIWDNWRIPETETEKKTYLCVQCNVNNSLAKSALIKLINVEIIIITHQDLMRVKPPSVVRGSNRIDFIGQRVEDLISRDVKLGLGETELLSNSEGQVDATHPCRKLVFTTTGINSNFDCEWSSDVGV